VEQLGFDLAAPGQPLLNNQIAVRGEIVQLERLGDFDAWDLLRRKSLEWRVRVMAIHVEPSDKDYALIMKLQNEISAETVRVYKAVDEQPFKKPVVDRSIDHRRKWEQLKRAPMKVIDVIDAEIVEITKPH